MICVITFGLGCYQLIADSKGYEELFHGLVVLSREDMSFTWLLTDADGKAPLLEALIARETVITMPLY